MKRVLAILFVLAMVACVMGGCDGDTTTATTTAAPTTTTTTAATTTTTTSATTTAAAAETYDGVLAALGINHSEEFVGLESSSYVGITSGIVDCQDYGYDASSDIVKKIIQTMYVSVDGYTDDQKKLLEDSMKAAFDPYKSLSCVTISYDMGTKYFKIKVVCADLDKTENVKAVCDSGLLAGDSALISMSKSDAAFIQLGYLKK